MIEILSRFAGPSCGSQGFFGFPTWYKYLPSVDGAVPCTVKISGINDAWLIVAAIIDMLLRVAALAAVIFIIYGGVLYITSEGSPDKAKKALMTIINAIVGLVIAVGASVFISFVAGRFN